MKIKCHCAQELGDAIGKYTCNQLRGCSVVDDPIPDELNINYIIYLEMLNNFGDISHHCALIWFLKCDNDTLHYYWKEKLYKDKRMFPPICTCDTSNIALYQKPLGNQNVASQINSIDSECFTLNNIGINESVREIRDI